MAGALLALGPAGLEALTRAREHSNPFVRDMAAQALWLGTGAGGMSELRAFWLLVTGFFVVINTDHLIQLVLAVVAVRRRMRALALEDYRDMRESGLTPPISIIVPAYNEGKGIAVSVRSLLELRYPRLEVVVVNDGSTDDTLEQLRTAFELERAPRVYWQRIRSKPILGIYRSRTHPGLWVLDKANGRKADRRRTPRSISPPLRGFA